MPVRQLDRLVEGIREFSAIVGLNCVVATVCRKWDGFGIGVVGCCRIPTGEEVLQVALQQGQQVVLRVILVVIGDTGEVEGHGPGKGSEGGRAD